MTRNLILNHNRSQHQRKKQEKNKIQSSNHRNQQRKTEEVHIVLHQSKKKSWLAEFLENLPI